jgi:hypothetical protein
MIMGAPRGRAAHRTETKVRRLFRWRTRRGGGRAAHARRDKGVAGGAGALLAVTLATLTLVIVPTSLAQGAGPAAAVAPGSAPATVWFTDLADALGDAWTDVAYFLETTADAIAIQMGQVGAELRDLQGRLG